jgi:hypothetical protein
MEKTSVNFTDEEKFTIGLFASSMTKKSCIAFKKSDDNTIYISATVPNKEVKKVEIKKSSETGFDAEIISGVSVLAHIHWQGTLIQLLMRMQVELLHPELLIDG